MIRNRLEPTGLPADHRIQALELRVFRGFELFPRHVLGIEPRSGRLGTGAVDEGRVVAETVPGPVVDLREAAQRRVLDRAQQPVLLAIGLEPERLVHVVAGLDHELQHLPLGVGQLPDVRRQADGGIRLVRSIGRGSARQRAPNQHDH